MRIAFRLLIAGFIIAAIAWGSALLVPPRMLPEDVGWIVVLGFGCAHVLLALLFLGSAAAAAFTLVRGSATRSTTSFLILSFALVLFAATSWYSWVYFYG